MYRLYDDVKDDDFIWIQCSDLNEFHMVVKEFVTKGFESCIAINGDYLLKHIIVDLKNKVLLYCGPSMAFTLKRNGVKPVKGEYFINVKDC